MLLALLAAPICACAQSVPDPATVRIDLKHILEGRINSRGNLVGMHHAPSAPETMTHEGRRLRLIIEHTSPGGADDVRTARVYLVDPETDRVRLEKFSTLFPDTWDRKQIETAIREAYTDAVEHRSVDREGRWQGRTRGGVRIDGYLSYDGAFIASAFPVYVKPRDAREDR